MQPNATHGYVPLHAKRSIMQNIVYVMVSTNHTYLQNSFFPLSGVLFYVGIKYSSQPCIAAVKSWTQLGVG